MVLLNDIFLGYLINFSHFHETYATKNPPKHSAKEMKEAEERSDNDSGDIFQASGSNEFNCVTNPVIYHFRHRFLSTY